MDQRTASIPTPLLSSAFHGSITSSVMDDFAVELDAVEAAGMTEGLSPSQVRSFNCARASALAGELTRQMMAKMFIQLRVAEVQRIVAPFRKAAAKVSIRTGTGSMRGLILVRVQGLPERQAHELLHSIAEAGYEGRFGPSIATA